jgi:hypothetical protein
VRAGARCVCCARRRVCYFWCAPARVLCALLDACASVASVLFLVRAGTHTSLGCAGARLFLAHACTLALACTLKVRVLKCCSALCLGLCTCLVCAAGVLFLAFACGCVRAGARLTYPAHSFYAGFFALCVGVCASVMKEHKRARWLVKVQLHVLHCCPSLRDAAWVCCKVCACCFCC